MTFRRLVILIAVLWAVLAIMAYAIEYAGPLLDELKVQGYFGVR